MCVEVEHVCIILEQGRALIRLTHMLPSSTRNGTPVAAAETTHLCQMALIHHLHLLLFFAT